MGIVKQNTLNTLYITYVLIMTYAQVIFVEGTQLDKNDLSTFYTSTMDSYTIIYEKTCINSSDILIV